MKLMLMSLLMMSALFASETKWFDDYNEAIVKAKVQKKNVYMLITSSSCRWCREFRITTLKDEAVMEKLKKNYILLHLSREKNHIPEGFKTTPIPRHYFITPSEETIFEDIGYRNESSFLELLNDLEKGH